MATKSELRLRATQVRTETEEGQNTAERVGSLFFDVIDWLLEGEYYTSTDIDEKLAYLSQSFNVEIDEISSGLADEKARVTNLLDNLYNEIEGKVNTMFEDKSWLSEEMIGVQVDSNYGDEDVDTYLQRIGIVTRDGQGEVTSWGWSSVEQDVDTLSSEVNRISGVIGDCSSISTLQSSLVQYTDDQISTAETRISETYTKIVDTEDIQDIVKILYSGLTSGATDEMAYNELVAAIKQGTIDGIASFKQKVDEDVAAIYATTSYVDDAIGAAQATLALKSEVNSATATLGTRIDGVDSALSGVTTRVTTLENGGYIAESSLVSAISDNKADIASTLVTAGIVNQTYLNSTLDSYVAKTAIEAIADSETGNVTAASIILAANAMTGSEILLNADRIQMANAIIGGWTIGGENDTISNLEELGGNYSFADLSVGGISFQEGINTYANPTTATGINLSTMGLEVYECFDNTSTDTVSLKGLKINPTQGIWFFKESDTYDDPPGYNVILEELRILGEMEPPLHPSTAKPMAFKLDGSGWLASGNISWAADGSFSIGKNTHVDPEDPATYYTYGLYLSENEFRVGGTHTAGYDTCYFKVNMDASNSPEVRFKGVGSGYHATNYAWVTLNDDGITTNRTFMGNILRLGAGSPGFTYQAEIGSDHLLFGKTGVTSSNATIKLWNSGTPYLEINSTDGNASYKSKLFSDYLHLEENDLDQQVNLYTSKIRFDKTTDTSTNYSEFSRTSLYLEKTSEGTTKEVTLSPDSLSFTHGSILNTSGGLSTTSDFYVDGDLKVNGSVIVGSSGSNALSLDSNEDVLRIDAAKYIELGNDLKTLYRIYLGEDTSGFKTEGSLYFRHSSEGTYKLYSFDIAAAITAGILVQVTS